MTADQGVRLSLEEATTLAAAALRRAGARKAAAAATAHALVGAEADGQGGHGLSRLAGYVAQTACGKIDGRARPRLEVLRSGAVLVDAAGGFAYPALDIALGDLPARARRSGLAAAAIRRSHHIGQAGRTVERLAEGGLLGLIVSNTPSAMAFWGGTRARMGTNPLAFAAPLDARPPLVIDLALSAVARSRIIAARDKGEAIPPGWAFDAEGRETADPSAALRGALAPAGGAKGAGLAMMVEILCAALAGGAYGWEASSFLDAAGGPPGVGQLLIALDPDAFAGPGFLHRMGALAEAVADEPGVRLPGDRRLGFRAAAARDGLLLSAPLHAELERLATRAP